MWGPPAILLTVFLMCKDAFAACPVAKTPVCPQQLTATNTFIVHPTSCHHYYQCGAGGRSFCMECPGNLYFNYEHKVCDWPTNVKCNEGERGQEPHNPFIPDTIFPPEESIGQSIITPLVPPKVPIYLPFPTAPLVPPEKPVRQPLMIPQHLPPSLEDMCGGVLPQQSCPEVNEEGIRTFLPHPRTTRCYFVCIGNIPKLRGCPGDLQFDPQRQYCVSL